MLRLPWLRRRGRFGVNSGVFCVLRFPDAMESRWLEHLPQPGSRLRSPTGKRWVVDEVLQSGRATYTVFLVSRREYAQGLRHRELADELLEEARETGRRRRNRIYRS